MKLALYARVSTIDKDQTPDNQLLILREYAKNRGCEVFKEYVDSVSGSWTSRPALDEMLKDARMRRFNAIVCVRIDRLGRSAAHLLNLMENLKQRNIGLIFTEQGLDTNTMEGELVFTILSGVAKMELELIKQRTREGLARVKASGKHIGRPVGGGKYHQLSMTPDAIRKRNKRGGK